MVRRTTRKRRVRFVAIICAAAAALAAGAVASGVVGLGVSGSSSARAASPATAVLPDGFHDTVAISGLSAPTTVRFAPDGRIFVAEKAGVVKEYDSLSDTTPTTVVDLSTDVNSFSDRGLLGLALDPAFPSNPYLYLLYTRDAPPGGTPPVWNDLCPKPPGSARCTRAW